MSNRILFTGLYPRWHYHFTSELNLLESHLECGDKATILTCDASLQACDCNWSHRLATCLWCIGIRHDGIAKLSKSIEQKPLFVNCGTFPSAIPAQFKNADELKKVTWDGFDLGFGVYSSLVDMVNNYNPCMKTHALLVERLLLDAWRTYESALQHIRQGKYDCVYIFNGRFAAARAWLRACQKTDTQFITHERTLDLEKVFLFPNSIPHDPAPYATRIHAFWDSAQKSLEITARGREFFEERPKGKSSGWVSFVRSQKLGVLPEGIEQAGYKVGFFATTECEFSGVQDGTANRLYSTQAEAFYEIALRAAQEDRDSRFFLRLHPNSVNEGIRWWESEPFRQLSNLIIIPADSAVSTYDLIQALDKVVVFRSTVGIEATYWGKPSIALAPPFYGGIDAVYEPQSRDEAYRLVLEPLAPKDQINAIKYATFMLDGGVALPHSKALNYFTLSFKGEPLDARREIHEWMAADQRRIRKRSGQGAGILDHFLEKINYKWFRFRYRSFAQSHPAPTNKSIHEKNSKKPT